MKFDSFFNDYKSGLKGLNTKKPWKEVPLEERIILYVLCVMYAGMLLSFLINNFIAIEVCLFIILACALALLAKDKFKKESSSSTDEQNNKKYTMRSNNIHRLLAQYKICTSDKNLLEKIIAKTHEERDNNDPFLILKTPLKLQDLY